MDTLDNDSVPLGAMPVRILCVTVQAGIPFGFTSDYTRKVMLSDAICLKIDRRIASKDNVIFVKGI